MQILARQQFLQSAAFYSHSLPPEAPFASMRAMNSLLDELAARDPSLNGPDNPLRREALIKEAEQKQGGSEVVRMADLWRIMRGQLKNMVSYVETLPSEAQMQARRERSDRLSTRTAEYRQEAETAVDRVQSVLTFCSQVSRHLGEAEAQAGGLAPARGLAHLSAGVDLLRAAVAGKVVLGVHWTGAQLLARGEMLLKAAETAPREQACVVEGNSLLATAFLGAREEESLWTQVRRFALHVEAQCPLSPPGDWVAFEAALSTMAEKLGRLDGRSPEGSGLLLQQMKALRTATVAASRDVDGFASLQASYDQLAKEMQQLGVRFDEPRSCTPQDRQQALNKLEDSLTDCQQERDRRQRCSFS
jgi:hypothetical protein